MEQQSQLEIDGLKTYLAGQGLSVPATVLKHAIFLPRDLDDDHRRYPKIIDQLLKTPVSKIPRKKRTKRNRTINATGGGPLSQTVFPMIKPVAGYNSKLYYKID